PWAVRSRWASSVRIGRISTTVASLRTCEGMPRNVGVPLRRLCVRRHRSSDLVSERPYWPVKHRSCRRCLRTVLDRDVLETPRAGIDLARAGDLLLGVVDHLQPLGDPAARAADGEQDWEHLDGHPERLIDQA